MIQSGLQEPLLKLFNELQDNQTITDHQFWQEISGTQVPEELSLRLFTVFSSQTKEKKKGN